MNRLERIALSTLSNIKLENLVKIFDQYNSIADLKEFAFRFPFEIKFDEIDKNMARLEKCLSRTDLTILEQSEREYPAILKEIADPPWCLFCKGNTQVLRDDTLKIAVVGARKNTNYGKLTVNMIVPALAESGVCIISGLAYGIDALAHKKALDVNGQVIGVLGCGVDYVYPKSNASLYKAVIENGCLLSEYLPWEEPKPYYFPARNRIISGLSNGVLVIEAATKSGSLITARCALEQNRDVFAIPGPINSYCSGGTNKLIQSGAKLIMKSEDILEEYPGYALEEDQGTSKKILESLEPDEKEVFELISLGMTQFDDLINKTGLNASTLNYTITMLTLKGVIDVVGTQYQIKV